MNGTWQGWHALVGGSNASGGAAERWTRSFAKLAAGLAAILVIKLSAQLLWSLFGVTPEALIVPVAAEAHRPAAGAIDLDALLAANLFQQYRPPKTNVDAAAAVAAASKFNVVGIFDYGKDHSRSRVLLADQPQSFGVGDAVGRGVLIAAIYDDHVLLQMDGNTTTLRLDRNTSAAEANKQAGDDTNAADDQQAHPPEEPAKTAPRARVIDPVGDG